MKKIICLLMIGLMLGCTSISFADVEYDEHGNEWYTLPVPPNPNMPGTVRLPHNYIVLTEGWSLIGIPVLPYEPLTVRDFMGMVTEDWEITMVAVYKDGQFERYPKEGITYNMVPGEAYFVHTEYSGRLSGRRKTAIEIEGSRPEVPVTLHLERGWNGISLLHYRNGGWAAIVGSLRTLSKELRDQGINATKVALWDADDQAWEEYELPFDEASPPGMPILSEVFPSPDNPAIYPIEGLFLLCEENGLYIPGLDAEADTVGPPFPDSLRFPGETEIIQKAKDDLCERLGIHESQITGFSCVLTGSIATCDIPPSHTTLRYEIGLVYGREIFTYDGYHSTNIRYTWESGELEIISVIETTGVEYTGVMEIERGHRIALYQSRDN